jgi:AcrR family transcriptional regulator
MDIKDKIITACRDLSSERGLHNINMDDLAARAGVSKRTVYRYFTGKEAIIEAALDAFMAEMAEAVAQIVREETEPTQVLSALQKYLFKHGQFVINPQSFKDLKQHYPYLWQKIDRFRLEQVNAILAFISASRTPVSPNDIDPRIAAAVILSSIQTVLNPDFVVANNLTFEVTAQQLSHLLMNGFLPR